MRASTPLFALLCTVQAEAVHAHSFGVIYSLPIPFWLYAWGAGAALIVSFAATALVATRPPRPQTGASNQGWVIGPALRWSCGAWGVAMLALTVASGLWGTPNAYANFSMTAFWIVFLLGLAYAQALVGDLYELLNPWRALSDALQRLLPRFGARAVLPLPGYSVAVLLYLGLIWVELIGGLGPPGLASLLLGYTLLCLLGAALFGIEAWFARGEVFSVLFGLLSRCAPIGIERDRQQRTRVQARWPGRGLEEGAAPGGVLIFILVMLASTAFDGLHETEIWYRFYWAWLYPEFLSHWLGNNPLVAFPTLNRWYGLWQSGWLLVFPLFYLLALMLCVSLMRRLTGDFRGTWRLASEFAYSLVPIALVYHVSHYYTLIWTQGVKIIALASDPFGRGHDWFGTANLFQRVNVPDVTQVWHVQVGLIVLGHAASVVLAHRAALRLFGTPRRALLSQLPMLALMIAYTVAGLWILSQPFQGGR